MCRIKAEGGLCAAHSRQRLAKAIASKDDKRIAAARLEFELTAGGIKELREQGRHFKAGLRQAERDEITQTAIHLRELLRKKSILGWETASAELSDDIMDTHGFAKDGYDKKGYADDGYDKNGFNQTQITEMGGGELIMITVKKFMPLI